MREIDRPYIPRDYQKKFESAMLKGIKRAFLLYHRRAGKDVACWNFMIYQAQRRDIPSGIYYYVLPTYNQGRKVIWDGQTESGLRFLDYIPESMREKSPNMAEMKVRLKNGSMIQVVGAENYNALRGTNPKGVVLSEFAMEDPRIWTEVISPILVKNNGWAVFNTTPLGKNHAYDLYNYAKGNPDKWFVQHLTIEDTGLFTNEQIEEERRQGKSEDLIQQEYYCSFERGIDGAFYSKYITQAKNDDRIGRVPYDPGSKVSTFWDLGFGDSTAIWFAQFVGNEIRLVDYYENHGEGLAHYGRILDEKRQKHDIIYDKHWAPHDVRVHELGSGISRLDVARSLGINFHITPDISFEDGIEAARGIFHRCYFDSTRCAYGIKCLENYRHKWNEKMAVYSTSPVHDFSSHGSDAFRYLAVNVKRNSSQQGLSKDEWKNVRNKNLFA